jgi:molybdopterin-guanine dinucleotide biosynthesis protein A
VNAVFDGAVLAGGRSRRMGRDKVPMFARVALDALRSAGATSVFAVGGGEGLEVPVVPDLYPGEGPLGGVITALSSATAEPIAGPAADVVVVLACDLPAVTPDVVLALVSALRGDVAMARVDDCRQPLIAAWRRTALPTLIAAFDGGERAVHRAVEGLHVVDVDVADAAATVDVDTPADLIAFLRG